MGFELYKMKISSSPEIITYIFSHGYDEFTLHNFQLLMQPSILGSTTLDLDHMVHM